MEAEDRDRDAARLRAGGGAGQLTAEPDDADADTSTAAKFAVDDGADIDGAAPDPTPRNGAVPLLMVDRRAGGGGGGFFVDCLRCGNAGGCRAAPPPLAPTPFPVPATFPPAIPP
jgi:hypothetical protein